MRTARWRGTALLTFLLVVAGPNARVRADDGRVDAHAATGSAAEAALALARIDSLLAAGQAAPAAALAVRAAARWRDEPLYGWQLQGRAGVALLRDGRPREAVPALEAALERNAGDGSLHHELGLALVGLGRTGRALAQFDEAISRQPQAVAPRLEAARLRAALGDWRRAGQELETARELCGGCPEADRLLGTVLLDAGRPAEAVAPLRRLWERHADPLVRRHLLAALAGAAEDSALLALVEATADSERTDDDWRLAVQAEGRRGGRRWAEAALAAASVGPVGSLPMADAVFWARVSLNLLAAGRPVPALAAVDRAVALAPDRALYHHNRAAVLVALGRPEEARSALADAARAPDHAGLEGEQ